MDSMRLQPCWPHSQSDSPSYSHAGGRKSHIAIGGRKLHFWRDRAGHEVDFILEEAGKLVASEIKASSQVTTSDATEIRAFRDDLKRKASLVRGVVLHAGVLALPWKRLVPK